MLDLPDFLPPVTVLELSATSPLAHCQPVTACPFVDSGSLAQ
jgi:hypothetical protein